MANLSDQVTHGMSPPPNIYIERETVLMGGFLVYFSY